MHEGQKWLEYDEKPDTMSGYHRRVHMNLPQVDIGNMDIKLRLGGLLLNVLFVRFGYFHRTIAEHSHSQGSYELHYIPSGYGELVVQGRRYPIVPGTLYMTGPDVAHEQIPDLEDPMAEYCIFFEVRTGNIPASQQHPLTDEPVLGELLTSTPFWFGREDGGLMPLFELIAEELSRRRIGMHRMITNLLEMILIRTIRLYAQEDIHPTVPAKTLDDSRMLIIENNFMYHASTISLKALSEKLGLSERQTDRIIRKQYGMSFQDKKKQARMMTAARLLRTTDWRVTEIARQTGYSTVEQFSHSFKKYYGMTASAYRHQSRAQPTAVTEHAGATPVQLGYENENDHPRRWSR